MKILLAKPRGFCAGVDRAVDAAKMAIEMYGKPVYIKHALVHNNNVVGELASMGAITVEHPSEAPEGSVIVFSAHGSPPEHYTAAKQRNQKIVDATCPLVYKVHDEAISYNKNDYKILLLGHKDHVEVKGTAGYAPSYILDERDLTAMEKTLQSMPTDSKISVLTQTTLSVEDTANAVNLIKRYFPNAVVRNDICYATTNRQHAVKELINKGAQVVVIVGSKTSSNANRMRDVAERGGVPAFLVDKPEEVIDKLDKYEVIGVSSGASTPEEQTEALCNAIKDRYKATLEYVNVKDEEIVFKKVNA